VNETVAPDCTETGVAGLIAPPPPLMLGVTV
jgi:hypothetical protein